MMDGALWYGLAEDVAPVRVLAGPDAPQRFFASTATEFVFVDVPAGDRADRRADRSLPDSGRAGFLGQG
jgi:hypothetical protein